MFPAHRFPHFQDPLLNVGKQIRQIFQQMLFVLDGKNSGGTVREPVKVALAPPLLVATAMANGAHLVEVVQLMRAGLGLSPHGGSVWAAGKHGLLMEGKHGGQRKGHINNSHISTITGAHLSRSRRSRRPRGAFLTLTCHPQHLD